MGKRYLKSTVRSSFPSDLGTEETRRRTGAATETTPDNHRRSRTAPQVPLDHYLARGGISRRQWEAGTRLYECFVEADISPSPKPLSEKISATSLSFFGGAEKIARNMEFWNTIIRRLGGIESYDARLLIDVCCFGFIARDLRNEWYPTSTDIMNRLREALDHLADAYGLPV